MILRRPRRWSDLSRVERVDVYTRQSLYLVLWLFCGVLLVSAASETTGATQTAAVVGGGLVVTGLGSLAMHGVIAGWPAVRPLPWPQLGLLVVASAAYVGFVGVPADDAVRGAVVALVVSTSCAALGALPDHRVTAALLVLSGLLSGLSGGVGGLVGGLVVSASIIFAVRVSLWLLGVVTELDGARMAQAQLAVAEERLRFSRDVHDVLGRRLSTIAVQSELAATLAERGDDRAAERMLDVRAVAHEALKEARELARGYRATHLGHEVEGARSLLRSAGIDVELDLDVVPRAWHEAAGWVVREAVTNVLRHSDAALVRIAYRDGELSVHNDGVPTDGSDRVPDHLPDGTGLQGLRERLQPLGATLTATRSREQWSVVVRLPGGGPVSATRRPQPPRPPQPVRDDAP